MEYRPRSFQEHIREIIGEQNKRGYWECPNCGFIKKDENKKKGEVKYADNKSEAD